MTGSNSTRLTDHGPDIAVVIPARDAALTIAEAIESVLEQTLPPLEVVVVDDGSTDTTPEIVGRFEHSVRVVAIAASGAGVARNTGVAATAAPWIAFLDADDRWTPDALLRLAAPLADDPTLDLVLGRQRVVPASQWAAALDGLAVASDVRPGAGPGSCLVARRVFEAVGGFSATWAVGEFIDWHLRAVEQGARVRSISDVVQWRRVHDTSTVAVRRDAFGDYARIIKTALDRRRSTGGV